jgi:hypothetical protein
LKFKTVGDIKIHQSEFCKPCNQNLTVDNGMVIYGDQTAFVKCSEGFKIDGNPFVFCLRTSKWEVSKMPTCKIVKCSPLKTPANGKLALSKISYKGRAKFTCDDGFSLEGNATVICLANGSWSSEIPTCKSVFECPALKNPSNGVLIYASDSGVIAKPLPSYPLGTIAQVKCNDGFVTESDNLISCSDQGEWDSEVEDCEEKTEATTAEVLPEKIKIPTEFWREFKKFLFFSCETTNPEEKSKLCDRFSPNFTSDLTTFEFPDSKEYGEMDTKLLKLLKTLQSSKDLDLTVDNFMPKLLPTSDSDESIRDYFRLVICLYIDLIIMDEELYDETSSEGLDTPSDNINDNIKKALKKVSLPIYHNQIE